METKKDHSDSDDDMPDLEDMSEIVKNIQKPEPAKIGKSNFQPNVKFKILQKSPPHKIKLL